MTPRCSHDIYADEFCVQCRIIGLAHDLSQKDADLLYPLLKAALAAPRKPIGAKQRAVNMLARAELTQLEDTERCAVAAMDLARWLAGEIKRPDRGYPLRSGRLPWWDVVRPRRVLCAR
jgi:hypothetical protein